MDRYYGIEPGGGDTGAPLNLRKRLRLMQQHINLHGKKVIDCGCGTGQYVLALQELGVEAYGIEYYRDKVENFRLNNSRLAGFVVEGNVEKMSFNDGTFDLAFLNEALEHIPDEIKCLREINRVLKPNGYLVIFSPNRLYPFETHGVSLLHSDNKVSHYMPFIPYIPLVLGNRIFRYHARNYWPWDLRRLVKKSAFAIIHTDYLWQTFENISGKQPCVVAKISPLLRSISSLLEKLPLIRALGVSQVIIARKL